MATADVVFDGQVIIPAGAFNFAVFREWVHSDEFPQQGRISFLDGEVDLQMSPEEIATHNQVKGDVYAMLWQLIRQRRLGHLLADRTLLVNEKANLSTEPDMTFCSYDALTTGRVQYRRIKAESKRYVEVSGSPDLVVEVVSASSVRKDTQVLPRLYFNAGILEFWRIDARKSSLEFEILTRGSDEYSAVEPDHDRYILSPLFNQRFLLTRDDDPVIGFLYTLFIK